MLSRLHSPNSTIYRTARELTETRRRIHASQAHGRRVAGRFRARAPGLTAFADNPHAGNSGKFKGSAQPCPQANPCPPHGG
jgi:hypothetical protein